MVEVDGLEGLAPEGAESRGDVADTEPEHGPRVEGAGPRDQLPVQGPVDHAAARDPTGSDHQIGAVDLGQQARQVLRAVGAVSIEFDDDVVVPLERPPEPGDVGGSEALLALAVHDVDLGILGGDPVGELPRAVRAVVVGDQDV